MKKITTFLLCTLISVASYSVAQAAQPTSGAHGANLTWTFEPTTGLLTISGTGEMYDTTANITTAAERLRAYPWNGFFDGEGAWVPNHAIQTITIEDGVTTIGNHAFRRVATATDQSLTAVNLPNSLITIGERAFQDHRILTTITIPLGVTEIATGVFANAVALANITFEGAIISIGTQAFGATTVAIGNSGPVIPSFTIPATVETIGNNAFQNRRIQGITIPPSVRTIGNSAFENTHITEFRVPYVTSLGTRVIARTMITSASDVTFPNGITHIPDGMFSNINLTSMTLPATVETIGVGAFALTATNLNNADGVLITGIQSFTFPLLVTEITEDLFRSNVALRTLTIPNTITRIGPSAFQASHLTAIEIPGSVRYVGANAFFQSLDLATLTLNEGLDTIRTGAFQGLASLTAINKIPSTVRYLGEGATTAGSGAFMNTFITTPIVLPEGLTVIGRNAFRNTAIPSVVIPNSVTTIGQDAFRDIREASLATSPRTLTSVEIGTGITTIGATAFAGNTNLGIVTINAPTPPVIAHTTFPFTPTLPPMTPPDEQIWVNNIILVVANEDAVTAYEAAPVWQDFGTISSSIVDVIQDLRDEITALNRELEDLEESVDLFFGVIADLLDIDLDGVDVGVAFFLIENAIINLDTLLRNCLEDLAACEPSSSVQGLTSAVLLQVHPNPTTDEIRIVTEWLSGDRVEIFNSRGQNVLSQQGGISGTTSELVINISSFPAGTYIVRVGNRIARVVKL